MHVITPGDHFSPSTGSAIPTVVDGLCRFAPPRTPRAAVVMGRSTYPDRYDSADIIEYDEASALPPALARYRRPADAGLGALGLPRWGARRTFAPAVREQSKWPDSMIIGHNAVQLMPLIDTRRHRAVLYGHNRLLRSYSRREVSRVLSDVAALVFVSSWLAAQEAEQLPERFSERVRVVHNGVDTTMFRRPGPMGRGDLLRVMFVGRMVHEKGADVLVEAVRRLGRADIRLVLVGSAGFDPSAAPDDYERGVREAGHALKRPAEVLPFVPRRQVARLLQGADVAVVPSRWPEPFALTALEGMAAGAVVVGSRIGGIPEAMGDAGILVRPDDPDDLAEALAALAADEAYRVREASRCVEHARAHDWARASAAFHDVLLGIGD